MLCAGAAFSTKACNRMNKPKRLIPYTATIVGLLMGAREALMAGLRPILREADLTEAQWRVLRVLFDLGSSDQTRLALATQLHAPSVSRILKELVERRLIIREPHPQDPRRSTVLLSDTGQSLVVDTAARIGPLVEFCAMRFGCERFAALQRELAAFTRAIQPQIYEGATIPRLAGVDAKGEDD
jgi:homoprotocatechuate degradation regulator HpaR